MTTKHMLGHLLELVPSQSNDYSIIKCINCGAGRFYDYEFDKDFSIIPIYNPCDSGWRTEQKCEEIMLENII